MRACEKALMDRVPLMACKNKVEFQQRLQMLSEGMLRNHIEGVINYTPDMAEIEEYRKYKDELS
jgi:hypothetical protein